MIVPFSKAPQPAPLGPSVGDLPPAFLLAALGQAHAEGKFHVYDPRLQFQSKDPGIEQPSPVESTRPQGIDPMRKQAPSDRTAPVEQDI